MTCGKSTRAWCYGCGGRVGTKADDDQYGVIFYYPGGGVHINVEAERLDRDDVSRPRSFGTRSTTLKEFVRLGCCLSEGFRLAVPI